MPKAMARSPRVRGWVTAREWAVWDLPRWLSAYVVAVTVVYALAIGAVASVTSFRARDSLLLILFLTCGAATVEMTRRAGEPAGLVKDVHSIWELSVAILLPPFYALVVPIFRLAHTQARIRRALVYRRVFSAAANGIAYFTASVLFHAVAQTIGGATPGTSVRALVWVLVVAGCGVLRWIINMGILAVALKGVEPSTPMRDILWDRELLFNDFAELCVAVLVTFVTANSVFLVFCALPSVAVMQRSLRHRQLVNASRIDTKTGLLNAAAWQREATVQVTRAIRTRTPLAVGIADIDHFKAVNDTYGHLTGDAVLAAIARAMTTLLRDYDLTGRFGGEEFVIALPQTNAEEARYVAERLRMKLAEIIIPVSAGTSAPSPLQVTVSIGIATLDGSRRDLDEMLAAADAALYEAKNSGRNRVCVLADSSPGA
jgi:diguanylate cyclase (GGDEF)-like protein